jgi:sortase (surface protein transpeptidase)
MLHSLGTALQHAYTEFMRTTVFSIALLSLTALIPSALANQKTTPAIPDTGSTGTLSGSVVSTTSPTFPQAPDKPRTTADKQPVHLTISSIKLSDPIENMGVLSNGELNVPNGRTNNVGWYAAGTVPGDMGSAVLDAHVFAALKNLRYVKPGDNIYITDADGTVLHFVVQTSEVFRLGQLSADYLFNRTDARRLTIITCAGHLTPDHSTYDHRLVVSAVLAS